MATKHAKFDTDWLTKSEYKHWLEKKDSQNAYCNKCDKTIYLSNMGTAALKSHAKGAKHQKALKACGLLLPVSSFFKVTVPPPPPQCANLQGNVVTNYLI